MAEDGLKVKKCFLFTGTIEYFGHVARWKHLEFEAYTTDVIQSSSYPNISLSCVLSYDLHQFSMFCLYFYLHCGPS